MQKGAIILDGKEIEFLTPRTALRQRIGMVYQNLSLIPSLNAVQNVYAGRMRSCGCAAGFRGDEAPCRQLLGELGVEIDLDVPRGG